MKLPTTALLFSYYLFVLSCVKADDAALPWETDPFPPAAYPLAVRSPYLSTWYYPLTGSGPHTLNAFWPRFWGGHITGWCGMIRVDGTTYLFLGDPGGVSDLQRANQIFSKFTATQSIFTFEAGPVNVKVTFLSPVEPDDLVKQSMPFSYMTVSVTSSNNVQHAIQVYSDISAEWVSSVQETVVEWNTSATDQGVIHSTKARDPSPYLENGNLVEGGTAYYGMPSGDSVTYQTGADVDLRQAFITEGRLNNTGDNDFRAVNDRWVVLSLVKDLGEVGSASSDPVVYSLGVTRDPAVRYAVSSEQVEDRSLYFMSAFPSVEAAFTSFIQDYSAAQQRADQFDAKIQEDAKKISDDYSAIVDLSIRQTFGALEITVAKDADGQFNTEDAMIFMKEIASKDSVNPPDVIFSAWPLVVYTNIDLGKLLLEPLLKYQTTGLYPNQFAVHDLGQYPNATGHNDGRDEHMPIEESGNMIIMALSYAQKTGDNSQLEKYLPLLRKWSEYLVDDSLRPSKQLSADDFQGEQAESTNLAIKGIISLNAMAQIEGRLGNSDRQDNLNDISSSYRDQFLDLAQAKDGNNHLTLNYGDDISWGLAYNLYADRMLQTNAFSSEIYEMQTTWYKSFFTAETQYGLPLDTRSTDTRIDWEMLTAAIMTDTETRDLFIKGIRNYAGSGLNWGPFIERYDSRNPKMEDPGPQPLIGGHSAFLALDPSVLTNAPGSDSPRTDGGSIPSTSGTNSPTGPGSNSGSNSRGDLISASLLAVTLLAASISAALGVL